MDLSGEFVLHAPRPSVWALFSDTARLAPLVPGCEGMEPVSEDLYRGRIGVKIGPVRASFEGQFEVLGREPETALRSALRGRDRLTGSVAEAKLALFFSEAGETTPVRYECTLALSGRLGQFGLRVVRGEMERMLGTLAAAADAALAEGGERG